jgi:hypothetical protein
MKSIEYWNKQKRHLMRVLRYARMVHSTKGIETYSNAVNRCDVKIGVISAMRRMVGVVILLACLIIAGCQTAKGIMGDGAWLLEKGAENITTEK